MSSLTAVDAFTRERPRRALMLAAILTLAGWISATSAQAAPTWLSPATRAASSSAQTDAAIDRNGNVLVVWRQFDGSNQVIKSAYRRAGGGFAGAQTLSVAGQNADTPHVEFDASGNAIVVWHRFNGANNVVQLRRMAAGGSFGAVEDVTGSTVELDVSAGRHQRQRYGGDRLAHGRNRQRRRYARRAAATARARRCGLRPQTCRCPPRRLTWR